MVPSNPVVVAAIRSIWAGGPGSPRIVDGWAVSASTGQPVFRHLLSNRPGHFDVTLAVPDRTRRPAGEKKRGWDAVAQLEPFDAKVALAMLALGAPIWCGNAGRPGAVVEIHVDDIVRGIRGKCRRSGAAALRVAIAAAVSRALQLRFEGSLRIGRRDSVRIGREGLFREERQDSREAFVWRLSLGGWAREFVATKTGIWSAPLPVALLRLPHYPKVCPAELAIRLGTYMWLTPGRSRPRRLRIHRLLTQIGALERPSKHRSYALGRICRRLRAAFTLLRRIGAMAQHGFCGDEDVQDEARTRNWASDWINGVVDVHVEAVDGEVEVRPEGERRKPAPEPTSDSDLWKSVRDRRLALGLSGTRVARHLRISPAFLSMVERGKRRASDDTSARARAWLEQTDGPVADLPLTDE